MESLGCHSRDPDTGSLDTPRPSSARRTSQRITARSSGREASNPIRTINAPRRTQVPTTSSVSGSIRTAAPTNGNISTALIPSAPAATRVTGTVRVAVRAASITDRSRARSAGLASVSLGRGAAESQSRLVAELS